MASTWRCQGGNNLQHRCWESFGTAGTSCSDVGRRLRNQPRGDRHACRRTSVRDPLSEPGRVRFYDLGGMGQHEDTGGSLRKLKAYGARHATTRCRATSVHPLLFRFTCTCRFPLPFCTTQDFRGKPPPCYPIDIWENLSHDFIHNFSQANTMLLYASTKTPCVLAAALPSTAAK